MKIKKIYENQMTNLESIEKREGMKNRDREIKERERIKEKDGKI